jgi:hypothetical protein
MHNPTKRIFLPLFAESEQAAKMKAAAYRGWRTFEVKPLGTGGWVATIMRDIAC